MDFYRGVVNWDFFGNALSYEEIHENNDALIKYDYGNSIFATVSGSFYLLLILFTFFTNKVIIDYEKFFRLGIRPHFPNLNQFSNTKTNTYTSQYSPDKTATVPKENETIDETPYYNTHFKTTEKHNITIHSSFNRKMDNNKKTPNVDGNVNLKKVMTYYHMHI